MKKKQVKQYYNKPVSEGIHLKKQFGQYFLRDRSVVKDMLAAVDAHGANVIEIGCGDGFLTQEILTHDVARLWVFEIDQEWAQKVDADFKDTGKLIMHHANFLDIDFSVFEAHKPWLLLSNLPYQVTFPILKRVQQHKHIIPQGVVMVQEEVAQKIVKKEGRGYGFISLFFQYHFDWKLLTKVSPTSFYPQPNVVSRLISFKARTNLELIPEEEDFWKFIKFCFLQPRRTLRNNLQTTHYDLAKVPERLLPLRAQQMTFTDFLELWQIIKIA